jgi:Baculoviridae late expression factor 5 C-terminal domain
MELTDHDVHRALLYYPSNAFRIGSKEELVFFKTKWNSKSDRKRVARIYRDCERTGGICPCRILFAFNVFGAPVFYLAPTRRLTRFEFTNEYQMKTVFFDKRCDPDVRSYNINILNKESPDLARRCNFAIDPASTAINAKQRAQITKKPSTRHNKRKFDFIEPIVRKAIVISDLLAKDVARIQQISDELLAKTKKIANDNSNNNNNNNYGNTRKIADNTTLAATSNEATLFIYLQLLRKRARAKFLKLDYFLRFRVILTDTDMYLPKLSKNKKFKKKKEAIRNRIDRDCLQFWGIDQQRQSLTNAPSSTDDMLRGQLLPVNDNPSHDWFHLSSRCRHDGGTKTIFIQTRCNDEMISSFTYCELCNRRLIR